VSYRAFAFSEPRDGVRVRTRLTRCRRRGLFVTRFLACGGGLNNEAYSRVFTGIQNEVREMKSIKSKQQSAKQSTAAKSRRGSLMIEMVVCTVLLSVVSAVLVPGIYAVHQQRKATRYETLTLLELNNLAAIAAQQGPQTLQLSTWFTDRYGNTTLQVDEVATPDSEPVTGPPPVRLTIINQTPAGLPEVKHSLVIWPALLKTSSNTPPEAAE